MGKGSVLDRGNNTPAGSYYWDEMKLEKGCPFCGNEVEAFYEGSSDWSIECEKCNCRFVFWINNKGIGESKILKERWERRLNGSSKDN